MRINVLNPYVLVSAKRARALKQGWRRPMPVLVQIDGKPQPPWRVNMMPRGDGSFYLYLQGTVRKASHTSVGDTVSVTLVFDAGYRSGPLHPTPSWLRVPLSKNRKARAAWVALTPSRKKEILRYLAALRSPEARDRNLARLLHVLSGHKARYMARTWRAGS